MSPELIFVCGMILGALIGMMLTGYVALKRIEELETVNGKLRVELRYAHKEPPHD